MDSKPSNHTTESAKNPKGQSDSMSAMIVGKPHMGNPEFKSGPTHVISPTSYIGHNSLEHGRGGK